MSASLLYLNIICKFIKTAEKNTRVIGWNCYCKDFYTTAREDFLKWHQGGRIRSGELFEKMKASRTNFKNAIKFCRINEDLIRRGTF